jgi:hypothetical protein
MDIFEEHDDEIKYTEGLEKEVNSLKSRIKELEDVVEWAYRTGGAIEDGGLDDWRKALRKKAGVK